MCSAAADWLSPRTNVELTALQAFTGAKTPSDEDLLREIHIVDEAGRYWAGVPALAMALQESPQSVWRAVGRAMLWPVIRPMADFGYRLVARYRRRVAV